MKIRDILKEQGVAEGFLGEADASAVQFRTASTDNYQSSFTVTAIADGKNVGHFSFFRDPETDDVHNQAEVTDDVRGKGYGKALLLKAIEVANDHGLGFQEDSQSLSRAQSRVYDSLYDAGWIVDADGYWFLTPEGEQELARLSTIQQGVAEARKNPEQNTKYQSGWAELAAWAHKNNVWLKPHEWAISMTYVPKLGINPGPGISEDTPRGIYFYPFHWAYSVKMDKEALPWADNAPYIQLFQYSTGTELYDPNQIPLASAVAQLKNYGITDEDIAAEKENNPSISTYNLLVWCLGRKYDDNKRVSILNKVLRNLGYDYMIDNGKGWIAINEPTQGVVLNPKIIDKVVTFNNYTRKKEQDMSEGLTEARNSLFAFVKQHFPTWPDYVLKDFLYPQAKGIRNQAELDDFLKRNKQDFGNCKWTLTKLPITFDIFTPKTQRMLASREGGSSNPFQVPRDAERHAQQSQMIQQTGVSAEPIIVAKLSNGYDLIEGWHRTIQHLKAFPQGYTGPAWVCTGATYKSESVEQDMAENFADGKNPGRKGLSKRVGVNTKASVSSLRKTAKNSSGEKQRMAHWLANMKAGRAKARRK